MPTPSHLVWMGIGVVLALFVFPLIMSFFSNRQNSN